MVSRDDAVQIIIDDFIGCIVHAQMSNVLEELLHSGWKSIDEWTDEELENFVSTLCEENHKYQ